MAMRRIVLATLMCGVAGMASAQLVNTNNNREIFNSGGTVPAAGITIYGNSTAAPVAIIFTKFAYTSTATVGNRVVSVVIKDAFNGVIMEVVPTSTQAASLTDTYFFAGGLANSVGAGTLNVPLPTYAIVPPGGALLVEDLAHIDVADTLTVATTWVQPPS
jgi:hypothetical protein